jgi:hypothetical protein
MDAYLDEPKFQSGVKKNGWKKEWKIFRHAWSVSFLVYTGEFR